MDWDEHLAQMKPASRERIEQVKASLLHGTSEYKSRINAGWTRDETWTEFKRRHKIKVHLTEYREAGYILDGRIEAPDVGTLAEFRKNILGMDTYDHMLQWQRWMEGPDDRIMIVTRPEAGKTSFLRDYVLWRIAKDPEIRIAYASATQTHAARQVGAVRGVIEANDRLRVVAGDLKPAPEQRHYPWSNDRLMVSRRSYNPGSVEADPTLAAFGLGGQIEGIRADLFIIDDPDGHRFTPSERENVFDRIQTVVDSRITVGGKLIILTNRWDTNDIAGLITSQEANMPGLWQIYSTPAIIREPDPDDPDDWGEVLWPEKFGSKSNKVADRWTAEAAYKNVNKKRAMLRAAGKERFFNLVYQNDPIGDANADFTKEMLEAARDRGKDFRWGEVPAGAAVVCAIDPAGTEGCGVIAVALLGDGRLVVVDALWGRQRRSEGMYAWMRQMNRYSPWYWGVEAQGPWKEWAESKEVDDICAEAGANKVLLMTGENKWRKDIGVASLVPLVADRLVIPSATPADDQRMSAFVHQLASYRAPERHGSRTVESSEPYDLLMSLWFAVRVINDNGLVGQRRGQSRNTWSNRYRDSWAGGYFNPVEAGARR